MQHRKDFLLEISFKTLILEYEKLDFFEKIKIK